jgi:hypothetical protein
MASESNQQNREKKPEGTNDVSQTSRDEKSIEFLKYAIEHIEKRIGLIDNKASLLIAIEAALLVLGTFMLKWLFGEDCPEVGFIPCAVILTVLALTVFTVLWLIWAIKPTKCLFSLKVALPKVKVERQILWPIEDFPSSAEGYKDAVNEFDWPKDHLENYERAHYVLAHHVKEKYKHYDLAILVMKITWLLSGLAIAVALILRICDC